MLKRRVVLDWLTQQKFTSAQLQKLHYNLGVVAPSISRKQSLLDNLVVHLTSPFNKPQSVIALDIGVKNMAMSRFQLTDTSCILQQCIKMDLNPNDLDFNPWNWSQLTKSFLFDQVLKPIDDDISDITILVERQRFRTGGQSSVLETTLKANTIESMIFMGVQMWNELLGKRDKRIEIKSLSPASMVNYWEVQIINKPDLVGTKDLRLHLMAQLLNDSIPKKYKIDNIPNMIPSIDEFGITTNITDHIEDDLKSWKKAWSYKSPSRRMFEILSLLNALNTPKYQLSIDQWGTKKGDDLTDSILYGLAFYEYQKFRELLTFKIINNDCINL